MTMGCSKNLVDSERLLALFEEKGFSFYHNPDTLHGDIAVVNTCGFIADAKEESIEMILSLCDRKAEGELEAVYVMGCLSERYREELAREIPEVDGFYGKFDWNALMADVVQRDAQTASSPAEERADEASPTCANAAAGRVLTTPSHYAYLKISEGCDRSCAYCAIPLITGHHKSRPIEDILQEVSRLVAKGVCEFQIIAQELTYYGLDLYKRQALPELIERMAQLPGVEWIRLHYAYPTHFPEDLLRVMRDYPNVCSYLDIALQHCSDRILDRMQRHITYAETVALIRKMRAEVPGISIRTTLMVGFPGETDEDFAQLMAFVREMRFDRMGAFAYSEEEGTFAAQHYDDNVADDVKARRLDELMSLQEEIAAELSQAKVGKVLKVIIDRQEGEYYIGRTEADSPEIDPEVLIPVADAAGLEVGKFYQVLITGCEDFDLYGRVVA